MSHSSPPPELQLDAEGQLTIERGRQADWDALVDGRSGHTAAVRSLTIKFLDRLPRDAWPALPRLTHLTIEADKRTLAQFPRVLRASALPALQQLTLRCLYYCPSAQWACPALAGRFEQLSHITIDGFTTDDAAIGALLRQPALVHLDLGHTKIASDGCTALAHALQERACPSLTHLDLRCSKIANQGCAALAQALQQQHACPELARLHLEHNNIDQEGCAALARALQQHTCLGLTHLHLGFNKIGSAGCAALAQALQQPSRPAVARLRLGLRPIIGAQECAAVPRLLRKGPCIALTHLHLEDNAIGDEGCARLAQALQERACPALSTLDLEGNNIGSAGCAAVARALLKGCPGLQQLCLPNNRIDAIPHALGELRALRVLVLAYNPIRRIPAALHRLVLQLEVLIVSGDALEDPPWQVVGQGLEALKAYLRGGRRVATGLRRRRL